MASGNFITTFSVGTYTFTFPTTQSQLRDNFSDMVPRTVRIPGADGGFDQFGESKAPSEIGNVSVTFEQYADSNEDLQTKRDLVREMVARGVGTLTKDCGAEGTRYCYARVNSITMTESPNDPIGSQKLTATVDFQVSDPYWLASNAAVSLPNVTKTVTNNSTPNIIAPDTLFDVYPVFTFESNASISAVYIGVFPGASLPEPVITSDCQFSLTGMIGSKRLVEIDCRNMAITVTNEFGVAVDGFVYATWERANFISLSSVGTIKVFVFVITAGTLTTSELTYVSRY